MDDADFEVTDLGQPRSPGPSSPSRPLLALFPRFSVRQRLARTIVILCLLVTALAPLLAVSPDASRSLAMWLHVPTPAGPVPLPRGANTFLLADTVPWGELTIDGRSAASLGIALQWPYAGAQIPTFTLAPGVHELVYRADPFFPLRCQVSVPDAVTDSCPLLSAGNSPLFPPPGSRILDARALPTYLPTPAFTALAEAVQGRLSAWTGVAPLARGDHYLSSDRQVVTAAEGGQATLRYQVNHDAREQLPTFNGACISLCALSPARTQLDADDWRLNANVIASWSYALADGQVVTAPAAPTESDAHALLRVLVRWAGQWRVDAPPEAALVDAPPCQIAHNMLGRLSAGAAALDTLAAGSWGAYAAPPAAAGCLIVVGRATSPPGQPIGKTIQALYRFGVVLAANATTQQVFGQLPPGNPAELALASHLAPAGVQ
jgi:hypothetical protein